MMNATVGAARILIVEDNPDVIALLERILGEQGYSVRAVPDGETGLARALRDTPDLILLDVGLPGRDGFEVMSELRGHGVKSAVLMLTARGTVADRITGLEAGADDYLPKPFDADELLARVRALLRRASLRRRASVLRVGDLTLDPITRDVARHGRPISLTAREFALLEYLMRNPGKNITRAAIAEQVWSDSAVNPEQTNVVDVYVAYLRRKITANGESPMLHTVRGVGYILKPGRGHVD